MTLFQINQIYQSLLKIVNNIFSLNESYDIFLLMKKIENDIEFFQQKETQLIEKYAVEIKSNGELVFSGEDIKKAFFLEYNQLKQMPVKEKYEKISLKLSSLQKCNLTPLDFFNLEKVIDFIEEKALIDEKEE